MSKWVDLFAAPSAKGAECNSQEQATKERRPWVMFKQNPKP